MTPETINHLLTGAAILVSAYAVYAARNGRAVEFMRKRTEEIMALHAALDEERQKRRLLEDRMEGIENDYRNLLLELERWKRGTERLIRQLRLNNIEPEWIPDTMKDKK